MTGFMASPESYRPIRSIYVLELDCSIRTAVRLGDDEGRMEIHSNRPHSMYPKDLIFWVCSRNFVDKP